MKTGKRTFRAQLEAAHLSQRELSRLLRKDPSTVNRWCSLRTDALEVPQYARLVVAAYARLRRTDRRALAEEFGALKAG